MALSIQTVNVGAAPNDGSGTPWRLAWQYMNLNTQLLGKFAANSADSTAGFLADKLIAGSGITLTENASAPNDRKLVVAIATNLSGLTLSGCTLTGDTVLPGSGKISSTGDVFVGSDGVARGPQFIARASDGGSFLARFGAADVVRLTATSATSGALQVYTGGVWDPRVICNANGVIATSGTGAASPALTIRGKTSGIFQGVNQQVSNASATVKQIWYNDVLNENAIPVSSIWTNVETDGSTSMQFGVTTAGSRTVDRRLWPLALSADGTTSAGAINAGYSLAALPVSNAVNRVTISGSSTGKVLTYNAAGADGSIGMSYNAKGTSFHVFTSTNGWQFVIADVASAVNRMVVRGGSAAGVQPTIAVDGDSADIELVYAAKGNYGHTFQTGWYGGPSQFRIANTASAVNKIEVGGAATNSAPWFVTTGNDTSVSMYFNVKGSGAIIFGSGGWTATNFGVTHTANAVNWVAITGAIAGASPLVVAQGSDTNVDLYLSGKGTGVVKFGTYTATAITCTGYITIKDAAGNTRRLMVG